MNMKAMKTLLILLLGFYICWVPLIGYFLTFASKKYNNLTIYILMFVACCNAVIDPLVYAFRNREFFKALIMNFRSAASPAAAASAAVMASSNTNFVAAATNPAQRTPRAAQTDDGAQSNLN